MIEKNACGRCRARCRAKFCQPCLLAIEYGNFDIVRPDGRLEAMPFSSLVEAYMVFRRVVSKVDADSRP